MSLSKEQRDAVDFDGHVVVTACPGSGKTRVLTRRVMRGLNELTSRHQRIIALTFTNRAADEIQGRLDNLDTPTECLWAGTIHSFALEWILRPYAPYAEVLRNGFSVADEHYTGQILEEIKGAKGLGPYDNVSTVRPRTGANPNSGDAAEVFDLYKQRLKSEKLLDYDDILYLAYQMLLGNPEVSETIAGVMPLICVDEVQDIQDLQYAILSQIVHGERKSNTLFFVGDSNQSIYESLGALTKTPAEIAAEFGLDGIEHLQLAENYRSTQRIVDYFTLIRPGTGAIKSLADYAGELGTIKFHNQTIHREALARSIAGIVRESLSLGTPASDICILAPHWTHVISLGRSLITHLPDVDFDAPGLSPLHSARDNIWFKVARLFLTSPSHNLTRTRYRWAKELIAELENTATIRMPDTLGTPRLLLRFVNSTTSAHADGLPYLREVFSKLMDVAGIDMALHVDLAGAHSAFFEKAESRITKAAGEMPSKVESLRKLFRSPTGVVINTCHGVKGEEYHTVIAFGLLQGYVPNWEVIINGTKSQAKEQASKLLYVICSRAKKRLYLISENGRETQSRNPYQTSEVLARVNYRYDD